MALNIFSEAHVFILPQTVNEHIILCKRKTLVQHHVLNFCRMVGFTGKFFVAAANGMSSHVGLGSTSSIVLAVLFAASLH